MANRSALLKAHIVGVWTARQRNASLLGDDLLKLLVADAGFPMGPQVACEAAGRRADGALRRRWCPKSLTDVRPGPSTGTVAERAQGIAVTDGAGEIENPAFAVVGNHRSTSCG